MTLLRNVRIGGLSRIVPLVAVVACVATLAGSAAAAAAGKEPPPLTFPPGVEGGYAPVNGLQLYYELHGPKDAAAPPLVLLHGGGSTISTSFAELLPLLTRTRRVIAFEQQGHGHTADVDRPFTFEQSADDTAGLLAHLGVERADLYGYSNGGNIAMQVAIRHPERVRRMVVASAMVRRDGLVSEFWESMHTATLESMPAELKAAYVATSPHPKKLQKFHDKCVERMLTFKDWTIEMVRRIHAPTLVMVADHDVVRPEHAVALYRLLPDSQLAILPGTDHMTLVHRADWQASMIEAFLAAPEAGAL